MPIIHDQGDFEIEDESGVSIEDEASAADQTVDVAPLFLTLEAQSIPENIVGAGIWSMALAAQSVSVEIGPTVFAGVQNLSLTQRAGVYYAVGVIDAFFLADVQQISLNQRGIVWVTNVITAWLQEQLSKYSYEPRMRIYIGSSDYDERIIRYPTIRIGGDKIKSVKVDIPLANDDGALNMFYSQTYRLVNSVQIQLGDYHPTSGWEGMALFSGYVAGVKYNKMQCSIEARDRLWDFSQIKVGDTDSIVEIPASGGIVPSEIAWTLCTCYGGLDATKTDDNADIDYPDFLQWAADFSIDNILVHGRFGGEKITEALDELKRYTDSQIWIGGDGKLHFKRYNEVNSLDYTWTYDNMLGIEVDVTKRRLINKQWVYWDYKPNSDYWAKKVFSQRTLSINTFGLYEEIEKSENVWFVDSISALNLATRRSFLYQNPPRSFRLETGLDGIWRELGETARFVDPFFNITSGSGWRIVERELHLGDAKVVNYLDEAAVLNAFYLDISYLDGNDLLI